jgi:hypothetical protein
LTGGPTVAQTSSTAEAGVYAYGSDVDLPKLWALTAENLNLAPHQHQEEVFKAILGTASLS